VYGLCGYFGNFGKWKTNFGGPKKKAEAGEAIEPLTSVAATTVAISFIEIFMTLLTVTLSRRAKRHSGKIAR
jgi:hypothetical protein